jgi:hypothetical protein
MGATDRGDEATQCELPVVLSFGSNKARLKRFKSVM